MKLVLRESEEDRLRAEMAEWDGYLSSALLGTEAIRACSRHGNGYAKDARQWLHDVALLPLSDDVLDVAASLQPSGLRSLDAIHLATALSVREELGVFLTYDGGLATAAEAHELNVARPA